MTGMDQGWEIDDYDDPDEDEPYPDDWWEDDRDDYEPDPEDAEIARSYAEYYEHCDQKHGGGHCDCGPPLRDRARWAIQRARARLRRLLRRPTRYSDEPPF